VHEVEVLDVCGEHEVDVEYSLGAPVDDFKAAAIAALMVSEV
jgi:hypothetical protein